MSGVARRRHAAVTDWDQAYDNRAAVGQDVVEAFIADLSAKAAAFRNERAAAGRANLDQTYGGRPRQRYDLFLPDSSPTSLAVFVHGGYWRNFDKSFWSHLTAGALGRNAAVAIPSYTLCPEVRIRDISAEVARFLSQIATEFALPIHLAGHSAGGHLVARMASGALERGIVQRIKKVVSISGVHDLRPLLRTSMNDDLRLELDEARAESPLLLDPVDRIDLTCWVGADELPAFRQQNQLLADAWHLQGARCEAVEAAGKNHFSVIEDLADAESALVESLLR